MAGAGGVATGGPGKAPLPPATCPSVRGMWRPSPPDRTAWPTCGRARTARHLQGRLHARCLDVCRVGRPGSWAPRRRGSPGRTHPLCCRWRPRRPPAPPARAQPLLRPWLASRPAGLRCSLSSGRPPNNTQTLQVGHQHILVYVTGVFTWPYSLCTCPPDCQINALL